MANYPDASDFLRTCLGCMADRGDQPVCRHCGFDENAAETHQLRIKRRTILKDQYLIGKVLGQGGFGITYLGLDLLLHKKVAIKEFLPSMLATRGEDKTSVVPFSGNQEQFFRQGLQSFIGEARSVAHFSRNVNIVNVNNYFEANNTGYMVMDYLEGMSLSGLIVKRGGPLPLREAFLILFPILDALSEVHKMGIYHRDISPQNIILTTDNTPVLIDFGAARQIVGEQSYSLDVVLKHGYSPLEQYTSRGKIGPWSDVYACGATLYFMITGKVPPPSVDRVDKDELIPPSQIEGLGISEELDEALLTALAVRSGDRYQSVEELKSALIKQGYLGYRRLLKSFLTADGVSLEHRMKLDRFLDDHWLNHDDAKLIEETLREESNFSRMDWSAEYSRSYEWYLRERPDEDQEGLKRKFHETYVVTKRISQGREQDIIRSISVTEMAAPKMEIPRTLEPEGAIGKKPLPVKAIAAASTVLVLAVLFVVNMKLGTVPFLGGGDRTGTPRGPGVTHGYINVWAKPPSEIYVNGKLMGLSPQSKIEVPAGQVVIRLLNKDYNIDETYTEFVEASPSQASN